MSIHSSSDPHSLVKAIFVMTLMCWGLLIVALTDHTHPATPALAGQLSN